MGDKAKDIGVVGRRLTVSVGGVCAINSYRVGYPNIARGDDSNFAFDDLIDVSAWINVASDDDVTVDVDLSAWVTCIAAEGLGDISICDGNNSTWIRVFAVVVAVDFICMERGGVTSGNDVVIGRAWGG